MMQAAKHFHNRALDLCRCTRDTDAYTPSTCVLALEPQTQYMVSAAKQLKNDGNALHSAGKYDEAVQKYVKAKSNVEGDTGAEAADLRKACMLNLSSCYLNLGRYDKCVEECDQVLAGEARMTAVRYRDCARCTACDGPVTHVLHSA